MGRSRICRSPTGVGGLTLFGGCVGVLAVHLTGVGVHQERTPRSRPGEVLNSGRPKGSRRLSRRQGARAPRLGCPDRHRQACPVLARSHDHPLRLISSCITDEWCRYPRWGSRRRRGPAGRAGTAHSASRVGLAGARQPTSDVMRREPEDPSVGCLLGRSTAEGCAVWLRPGGAPGPAVLGWRRWHLLRCSRRRRAQLEVSSWPVEGVRSLPGARAAGRIDLPSGRSRVVGPSASEAKTSPRALSQGCSLPSLGCRRIAQRLAAAASGLLRAADEGAVRPMSARRGRQGAQARTAGLGSDLARRRRLGASCGVQAMTRDESAMPGRPERGRTRGELVCMGSAFAIEPPPAGDRVRGRVPAARGRAAPQLPLSERRIDRVAGRPWPSSGRRSGTGRVTSGFFRRSGEFVRAPRGVGRGTDAGSGSRPRTSGRGVKVGELCADPARPAVVGHAGRADARRGDGGNPGVPCRARSFLSPPRCHTSPPSTSGRVAGPELRPPSTEREGGHEFIRRMSSVLSWLQAALRRPAPRAGRPPQPASCSTNDAEEPTGGGRGRPRRPPPRVEPSSAAASTR